MIQPEFERQKMKLRVLVSKRQKSLLEKADFVIIVLDSSKELSKEDYEILDLCKNSTGVFLVNKSDCNRH